MVAPDAIQAICDRIVGRFQPVRVILFGSHAYGTPTPDSDVDLLVILHFEGSALRKAAEVSQCIPRGRSSGSGACLQRAPCTG